METEQGNSFSQTIQVTENQTASHFGSGLLPVFATPALIALMENTSMHLVTCPEGSSSVGISIDMQYLKASRYISLIIFTMSIPIILLSMPLLSLWINQEFASKSSLALTIVMFGYLIQLHSAVPYFSLMGLGESRATSIILFVNMIINLLGNIILIPKYNIEGAGLSFVLSVVLTIPAWLLCIHNKLSISWIEYFKYSLMGPIIFGSSIAGSLLLLKHFFTINSFFELAFYSIIGICVGIFFYLISNRFDDWDKSYLTTFFKKMMPQKPIN